MGHPVPEESPDIAGDKWYWCEMDSYFDATPDDTCSQAFIARVSQCRPGAQINAWLDAGQECLTPFEFVFLTGFTAQRLVRCVGPYADQAACELVHPP